MQIIEHILLLDVLKQGFQQHLGGFKSGEANVRQLSVILTAGGCPLSISEKVNAELYIKKPDGTVCHSACAVDADKNIITHIMTTSEVAVPGRLECEIRIQLPKDDNDVVPVLYSPCFDIIVDGSLYTEDALVSENENTEWTKALQRVADAEARLQACANRLEEKADKSELGNKVNAIEKTKKMTASVGIDEDGKLWFDPTAGGDVSAVADRVDKMEEALAELTHEHIKITKFTLSRDTAEMGDSVQVLIEVGVDKAPVDIKLLRGAEILPLNFSGTSGEVVAQGITANTTFKLIVTDDMEHEIVQTKTISFYNGVYTGVGGDGAEIGSLTKKLQGSRGITFTATAGEGEYIYYACPAGYGTPAFYDKTTGFQASLVKVREENYTNSSGYTEEYQVWRSVHSGLGTLTVEVK